MNNERFSVKIRPTNEENNLLQTFCTFSMQSRGPFILFLSTNVTQIGMFQLDPTNNTDYDGNPYPFGMDPVSFS